MPTVTPRTDVIAIKPVPGKRHQIRKWIVRVAIALAILAPLAFMLGAVGAKLGLWSWQFGLGFMTRKLGVWLLMGSVFFGAASLLLALLLSPRTKRGIIAGGVGLLVGVGGLVWLKSVQATVSKLPFIHDITTDTQTPPVFAGRILQERGAIAGANTLDYTGKTDPKGKLVSVSQAKAYPNVRPIVSERTPEDAFSRAQAIAEGLGWEIKDMDGLNGTIEATDTTFWYGFEDDVVIRIRPGAGGGSVIDLRSVSRVGASDIGANAARIRDFITAFGN